MIAFDSFFKKQLGWEVGKIESPAIELRDGEWARQNAKNGANRWISGWLAELSDGILWI
jgi:hypothetical protein